VYDAIVIKITDTRGESRIRIAIFDPIKKFGEKQEKE